MKTIMRFEIHPAIGVARVGNSPDQFYLAPDLTADLPRGRNSDDTPILRGGKPMLVSIFKDTQGRVKKDFTNEEAAQLEEETGK